MRTVSQIHALIMTVLAGSLLTSCSHSERYGSVPERRMTVGLVQKEIRIGMTQAAVAEALGSPNIVTKDSDGKETWVYDKIATEAYYTKSNVFGNILILGASKDKSASGSSQRTLTVILKFDSKNAVESVSYHASSF